MSGFNIISGAQSFGYMGVGNGHYPTTLDLAFETASLEHMPLLYDARDFEYEDTDFLHSEPDHSTLRGEETTSSRDPFTLVYIVFGIPAAHLIVACMPVALGWTSTADVVCYFVLMFAIGLILDVVFLLALLVQLLHGLNLRDAMPAAVDISVRTMIVFVLLSICGCELWLLALGGMSAGVAF